MIGELVASTGFSVDIDRLTLGIIFVTGVVVVVVVVVVVLDADISTILLGFLSGSGFSVLKEVSNLIKVTITFLVLQSMVFPRYLVHSLLLRTKTLSSCSQILEMEVRLCLFLALP